MRNSKTTTGGRPRAKVLVLGLAGLCMASAALAGCSSSDSSSSEPVDREAGSASSDQGSSYKVGDKGPGGGTVFYVDESAAVGSRYMEAAPKTWNSTSADPQDSIEWCSNTETLIAGTFGTAIGTGKTNTDNMVAGGACTSGAANIVRGYGSAGAPAGSWSLPSLEELKALDVSGVGALPRDFFYWSSSQGGAEDAWFAFTGADRQLTDFKDNTYRVLPVRAF